MFHSDWLENQTAIRDEYNNINNNMILHVCAHPTRALCMLNCNEKKKKSRLYRIITSARNAINEYYWCWNGTTLMVYLLLYPEYHVPAVYLGLCSIRCVIDGNWTWENNKIRFTICNMLFLCAVYSSHCRQAPSVYYLRAFWSAFS